MRIDGALPARRGAHGRPRPPGGALVARERALRHAGLALVGATGLGEIYAAAIEAVQSLVGRAVAVWVVDVQEDGCHIVASSDGPRGSRAPDVPAPPGSPPGRLGLGATERGASRASRRAGHRRTPPDRRRLVLPPLSGRGRHRIRRDRLDEPSHCCCRRSRRSARRSHSHWRARCCRRTSTGAQSEARFRSLVAHSTDLITVLGADGDDRLPEPLVERVLGYGPTSSMEPASSRCSRSATAAASRSIARDGRPRGDGHDARVRAACTATAPSSSSRSCTPTCSTTSTSTASS